MSEERADDYRQVAVAFAKALASRDYAAAYGLTSESYRRGTNMNAMRADFEGIVPTDWGAPAAVELGLTMEEWPGKESSDVGWAYVTVGGDTYSEAVTVVVQAEAGALKVRTVEFGRP
jgi:hypothetical protein